MATSRENFALDWIKSELLETLNQARQSLEAYAELLEEEPTVEGDRAASSLHDCLNSLHQAHGTLVMLELTGVTLLADHLERLAEALSESRLADVAAACQTLMQGILELPGYLDELQAGLPDSTSPMLPLVNELRAYLGETPIVDETSVASLSGAVGDAAVERFTAIDGMDKARRIRGVYQQVLLSVLKGEDLSKSLDTLGKVAQGLRRVCEGTPFEAQWQAFAVFVASLAEAAGGEELGILDSDMVKLLRRVDSEIRELAQRGGEALRRPVPIALVRQLLDAAESRGYRSPLLSDLKGAAARFKQADGLSISGRQALVSAALALREELALIKDRLDLFVRADNGEMAELDALLAPLKQIGSTLSLLGFESSRTMVSDQVDQINGMIESGKVGQAEILTVAGALMRVDENLASFAQSGKSEVAQITDDAHRAVALETRHGLETVKQSIVDFVTSQWDVRHIEMVPAELEELSGALRLIPLSRGAELLDRCNLYVKQELLQGHVPNWEELDLLADAISGIDYYLERLADDNPAGATDVLEVVQRSLESLGSGEDMPSVATPTGAAQPAETSKEEPGAEFLSVPEAEPSFDNELEISLPDGTEGMETTPLAAAAEIDAAAEDALYGAAEEVDVESVGASVEEPPLEMDSHASFDLANAIFDDLAISSKDIGGPSGEAADEPDEFEDFSEDMAEAAPEAPALSDAGNAASEALAESGDGEPEPFEQPGSTAVTPAPRAAPVAAATRTASLADTFETDDEIVEIFVEEVDEVLESIDRHLPAWEADLQQEHPLGEIRRAFHTLKGSGRMVGANVLGELAWSVENMLNRIIDATVVATADFPAVIRDARKLAPVLRDAYEAKTAPDMQPVGQIMEHADVLASGGSLAEAASAEAGKPARHAVDESGSAPADLQEIETAATSAQAPEVTVLPDGWDLFVVEAEQHLAALGVAADESGFQLGEEAMRALHTLAGSAAMAGIQTIAELASPVYELAQAARQSGKETRVDGEAGEFFRQVVAALSSMVEDLKKGLEPEEQFQLIAEADRLLMVAPEASRGPDPLLELNALEVVIKVPEFLTAWHEGAVDLSFGEQLREALAHIQKVAEERDHQPVASLSLALREAHERFEFESLCERERDVFARGHEKLLQYVDTIAADQVVKPDLEVQASVEGLTPTESDAEETLEADEMLDSDQFETPDFSMEETAAEIFTMPGRKPASEAPSPAPVEKDSEQQEAPQREEGQGAAPESEAPAPESPQREEVPHGASPEASVVESFEVNIDDVDEEIIEVFFEEAEEIAEELDQAIHEWSETPDNLLHLENLLRSLHTLKGGARLAGLVLLGDHTHEFESFLIDFQDSGSPADATLFGALHAKYDEITGLITRSREALAGGDPTQQAVPIAANDLATQDDNEVPLLRTVETAAVETAAVETAPAAPTTDDQDVEADADEPLEHPAVAELRVESARAAANEEPEATPATAFTAGPSTVPATAEPQVEPRAPQEMVRVGAGLLEELVNLAGESSIVRARIEQGMSDFTSSLDEMETTIERLREQLRRLEIETEAQILFRQDRVEGPSYEEFDPLEMDRYSQLQQLSRALSESASDMLDLKDTLLFKARESETLLLQQARLNTELQEGLMRSRMVPFSRLLPRLRRTVRQVSKELDKEVELHAFNVDGELDRNLLERMVPPLEHMLRNAVDHGIESSEQRKAFGKPVAGRVDLRLAREGGDVVIEISDDGAGIDVETVRAKAVERGLMTPGAELQDDEISQFVLAPGFSTAKSVTQISGRGVGMDVVHSEVKQLGGSINIFSQPGKGTRFVVRVPFTVSVNRALMVSVSDDLYAIPLNTIEGIVLLSPEQLEKLYAPDGNTFEYAGVPYQVRYLGNFLGREYHPQGQRTSVPIVLVRSGEYAVAVHVDGVQGSREIVVKSLGPQFAGVGGISGATILGDGSVVVILDLLALIRTQGNDSLAVGRRPRTGAPRTRSIMVVDDSVTVRKVTSRLLERQGMDVMVAKDGIEAVAMLQERRPDVMLLDIEMPRMDGFEVARQVRHDDRLADLPIIMISSRTGEKHQERALGLGVNRFLGKPFQESELLASIDELVS